MGNFDGIHTGHQLLINKVIAISNHKNSVPGIITFSPHPSKSLDESKAPHLLTPLRKKIEILQSMGMQLMAIFDFNHKFSKLSPGNFIKEYLTDIMRVNDIVIGENFKFGKNREGDPDLLLEYGKKLGFNTYVINSLIAYGEIISSSRIRNYIKTGDILKANELLGRYFSVSGKVQKGRGIGGQLGFPTANMALPEGIVPKKGVYITLCSTGAEVLPSIANIGTTPSIRNRPLTLEVHILGEIIDLNNEDIEVFFIERVRDEEYFTDIEVLKEVVLKDIEYAKQFFLKGDILHDRH